MIQKQSVKLYSACLETGYGNNQLIVKQLHQTLLVGISSSVSQATSHQRTGQVAKRPSSQL